MKLKHKLIIGGVLLAGIPTIVSSLVIKYQALDLADEALKASSQEKLVNVLSTVSSHVESYFKHINSQVITFANDWMIIDAMQEFKSSFDDYLSENSLAIDPATIDGSLRRYYEDEFNQTYREMNANQDAPVSSLLNNLDLQTKALQYAYISNNPNPLGEKDSLEKANDGTRYAETHEKFHPHIRDYLQHFGYYDIFLVDPDSGKIIYSVFKELDYATSLHDGPYADSGIAQAFKAALRLPKGDTALIDFAPYTPSYEAPASFISSPIYDGKTMLGVLIFQMPVGEINHILTHAADWQKVGLGLTGETYLVGPDKTMRSLSRDLIQDESATLSRLDTLGISEKVINSIRDKNTTMGLLPVNSQSAELALSGNEGFLEEKGLLGDAVFSVYAPLDIPQLNYAIVAEIEESEATAAVGELRETLSIMSMITMTVAVLIGVAVSLIAAIGFVAPIKKTIHALQDIAEGEGDLTRRLDSKRSDEFGDLAHWFNAFADQIKTLVTELITANSQVQSASNDLRGAAEQSSEAVENQHSQTEQIASAMTEMTATVEEVARNTQEASQSAQTAHKNSAEGLSVINENVAAIIRLSDELHKTADVVTSLNKDTNEIGSVLGVIEGIAEQTNLLALNAAIEAARAGESGRGFAVVADEVRSLAQKTQGSTHQIKDIIERLQKRAGSVVEAMEESNQASQKTVEKSNTAKTSFEAITEQLARINDVNFQIASAAEEQHATSDEISKNVVEIRSLSEDTTGHARNVSAASTQLAALADQISNKLKRFKV